MNSTALKRDETRRDEKRETRDETRDETIYSYLSGAWARHDAVDFEGFPLSQDSELAIDLSSRNVQNEHVVERGMTWCIMRSEKTSERKRGGLTGALWKG